MPSRWVRAAVDGIVGFAQANPYWVNTARDLIQARERFLFTPNDAAGATDGTGAPRILPGDNRKRGRKSRTFHAVRLAVKFKPNRDHPAPGYLANCRRRSTTQPSESPEDSAHDAGTAADDVPALLGHRAGKRSCAGC
jgi:hypothetical protein